MEKDYQKTQFRIEFSLFTIMNSKKLADSTFYEKFFNKHVATKKIRAYIREPLKTCIKKGKQKQRSVNICFMGNMNIFESQSRKKKLEKIGDPLRKLSDLIDFEVYRRKF